MILIGDGKTQDILDRTSLHLITVIFQQWSVCSPRRGEWVCSLKCRNEMAEITLQNAVDMTRRAKTILRSTSSYSHNSLGDSE